MKQYFLTFLFLLTMLFPIHAMNEKNDKMPDFRYPETVTQNANKQLDQAIKSHDGHAIVSSLVQIGLAKTSISRHNLKEVCENIDKVLGKETWIGADLRSLIYLLEAKLVDSAPYDVQSPYTKQELWEKALNPLGNGDVSALKRPLKDYEDLITPGSELGNRAIPTLLDFVTMRVAGETYFSYEQRQNWLSQHLLDEDIMPRLYIEEYISRGYVSPWNHYDLRSEDVKLYEKYNKYPESALFLMAERPEDKDYNVLKDCLKRFPDSDYSAKIQNMIAQLEDSKVDLSYSSLLQSTDPLIITARTRNVNDFNLTLYRLPKVPEPRSIKEVDVTTFTPIQTVTVHADGQVPFDAENLTAQFKPVPYGVYIVLASYDTPTGPRVIEKMREDDIRSSMISVSDLRTFEIRPEKIIERDGYDYTSGQPSLVFAVNSQTGRPESNVSIVYSPDKRYNRNSDGKTYETSADGFVTISMSGSCSYTLSKGQDTFLPAATQSVYNDDRKLFESGLSVHTDLGIYRPGEEIRLSVIAWNAGFSKRQPVSNVELKVVFRDASSNEISSQTLTTDAMGQAVTSFQIPTDRMNGRFSFRISSVNSKDSYYNTTYVDVSEYKTPSFFVDLSENDTHQLAGAPVKLKGRVMTYSGMPVAEAEVSCRLESHPWLWWYENENNDSHVFTVNTDKEGRFEYTCPEEWTMQESESGARRPFLTYHLKATCTNAAGETHEGSCEFWIGRSRGLSIGDQTICLKPNTKAPFNINYEHTDPAEKNIRCHYQLSRVEGEKTTLVLEEDFMTDDQHYHWDKVPSGEYLIKAYIVDDKETEPATAKLVLYRESDTMPPVESPLWVPYEGKKIDEDGHIRVQIGTSTGSHIYYIVTSNGRQESAGWLHYEPGMHWFTAEMPKALDEQINIRFYSIHEGQSYTENAYFRAPWRDEANLTAVTFRDKIRPGSTEHWTFRLTDQKGNPIQGGRMMLELYNEALYSLSPNNWHLNAPTYSRSLHSYHTPTYYSSHSSLQYYSHRDKAGSIYIKMPTENYYGQNFYSQRSTRSFSRYMVDDDDAPVMLESAPMLAGNASVMMSKAVGRDMEDAMVETEESKPSMSDVVVRADEVKVALWQPQLISDANGDFSVEFEVPNFNTTYHLQALAYTSSLNTDRIQKKVLAQRPVMVQASLPRFLLAGDVIALSANVMNATDSVLMTDALIELFDPRTEAIVKTISRQLQLEAHATEVIRIDYEAPQDAPYIGFRVKALAADGNGDGEQQMLPILSSITPVIETQPFYMQPQTSELSLDILAPASAQGTSRLTFEYCNNPTWYCVTALPSIIDTEAITSPSLAHNLFAIALAGKLTSENPLLAEAVSSWKDRQGKAGDVLVSQLQQNEDLKISSLLASPWLPEAERQTLRMQALDQLFDAKRNAHITSQMIASLKKLQANDGGFLWLDFGDRSESSYWATSQVLELLGEIHRLGCLPDDSGLRTLITEATHYFDKATLKAEQEMIAERKKFGGKPSYMSFWSYVYTRQMLNDIAGYQSRSMAKDVMSLVNKTLKELGMDWGSLSMTSRALAAVTLHRYGRTSEARGVMESVRQFALHDPHKGMYWESLDRYSWFSPVACTSAMLQAFAEVSPRQSEIDEMREWLLLEKQTSDWGSSSLAADAVYAILSTGSDWLHASVDSVPQFQILIDGNPVDVSETDRHLGYVRMSLPSDAKRVEVSRTGVNPAWGSLYHQYKAEMTEVKAHSVDELSIAKQLQVVDAEGKAQQLAEGDTLQVGQRVRVTLRIHAAKDLEYVTLIDQRPSFLEPVDQKSHYTRSDRFYYYLETKDAVTNAFITRLPEGNHLLTYDCFVTAPGCFTSGIATIQSQYAPQFVANSSGSKVYTNNK